MQFLRMLALTTLPLTLLPDLAMAKPFPGHAMVVFPAGTQAHPTTQFGRRTLVHGLPSGWVGVFETVTSIQPPLINPAFIQFFSTAVKLATSDPVPGRPVQRIPFGALILEFIADGQQNQVVTKEFVAAASLWLLDAAQKGWTGFFNAWVMDMADGNIIYVRLGSVWDELMSLSN